MPILPQQETIVQYVTNSAQFNYTFAFYAPFNTDIQVFYQAPNATPIPSSDILTLGSDYTVTYNSDPTTGGFITLLFTPTTGYYLTINRDVAASLVTNFSQAQNFNGANLDAALDRLLLLIQQNKNYALERNLSYVINTYLPNASPYTQLPPLPQNFVWVGSGAGVVAAELAAVPSASVLQSMLANASPGTDGARLVGYYDTINSNPTTVDAYLTLLTNGNIGVDGARLIGYYDILNAASTTVDAFLQNVRYVAADTGSVNALAITIAATGFTLKSGQVFLVKAANTNTLASTLAINGGSAIPITVNVSEAIVGGAILQNQECLFVYDGTNMQLLNPSPTFYGAAIYMNATQSIAANANSSLNFNTVSFDPYTLYTNTFKGFAILKAGYYRCNCNVQIASISTTDACWIGLYVGNVEIKQLCQLPFTGATIQLSGSATIHCNVGDIVRIFAGNINVTNAMTVGSTNAQLSNFDIQYLGS